MQSRGWSPAALAQAKPPLKPMRAFPREKAAELGPSAVS